MPARDDDGIDPGRAPDAPREGTSVSFLLGVLDDMIGRAGATFAEGMREARKGYDERRGRVFEDEELWEVWTQAFLEWYVVERPEPLGDQGAPLSVRYAAELDAFGDARAARAARAWARSHRSLFEVRALRAGTVELLDLIGGGQFAVDEQRAMVGVSPGHVAEVRLIGFEGRVHFGRTFCFHPEGTREAIIGHVRRMAASGSTRHDIVDFCAGLRIRCERYRHVSPRRIYEIGTGTFERAQTGGRGTARSPGAGPGSDGEPGA